MLSSVRSGIASFLKRLRKKAPSVRPTGPQYPLGLTVDQVHHLRQLVSTPQWRTYTEALQQVFEQEVARIISGLPQEQYQLKCGKVQALLDVLSLPETIDAKAQEIDEHNTAAPADPSKRDLTFFGTGLWSPSRKPRLYGPDDPSANGSGSVARP